MQDVEDDKSNGNETQFFERKIFRKIFGYYHDPNTNQYRMRTNAEVKRINNAGNIVQEIKSQCLR